jgi:D-sedoheptulose 7-phosphate isomerase
MLEQRIQQQFFESADLQYQAAEALARPIAQAVQALETGLTSGGRLLVAGSGHGATLAKLMVHLLVQRFERERPGLGAVLLGDDVGLATSTLGGLPMLLARQIETLGQPGDLLMLIDAEGSAPAMLAAAAAAQAKDMTVIVLTGAAHSSNTDTAISVGAAGQPLPATARKNNTQGAGAALAAVLSDTDVLVAVPHPRAARVLEAQLLVLHCLCDALDLQLLGEQDPS